MCGIAGILHFDSERPVDRPLLDRMTDILAHRGPDGRGVHVDGPLGLGHRRLAIVDLSDAAAQPLANEDGSVRGVFNGEIYNFQQLRCELEAAGHRFRSRTDSEVLVHLYEEMGERLVDRLRGQFAFALWDARRRRMLLARDRFGQKPLYYRLTDASLAFGSEIKAILEDPGVPRTIDRASVRGYLTFGYVPGPATAFGGIRKLPPAHTLTVEADGRSRLGRYWRLPRADPAEGQTNGPAGAATGARRLQAAAERLRGLLDEATQLRKIADVPLGVFLSGGLDSSAVAAAMEATRRAGDPPLSTFTIGFRDGTFDESAHAARVARHLGTDHRRLEYTPGDGVDLERIVWHYGEPFADASCLPTYALAKLAREHVTVALTGDGGDELLYGYKRYLGALLAERVGRLPAPVAGVATSPAAAALLRAARLSTTASELSRLRGVRNRSLADLYRVRLGPLAPGLEASLCEPEFAASGTEDASAELRRALGEPEGGSWAERCARRDAETYLPDDILVKVDVAGMAHGLECRAPFLDHRLAEAVARLPPQLKLTARGGKRVLRAAVADRLPRTVLARSKRGFNVPLGAWLGPQARPMMGDLLLSRRALERGYFRPAAVRRLVDGSAGTTGGSEAALFALLMLEMWHRQWVDPGAPTRPPRPAEPTGEAVPA